MISATVNLLDGMQFAGISEEGHTVIFDPGVELGGKNEGFAPMEMLLMALGACTGMDVIMILRKKRQNITSYSINLRGERADDYPKIFTHITMEHVVKGVDVSDDAVRRAVELSIDKYCSVFAMLKESAKIDVSIKLEGNTEA